MSAHNEVGLIATEQTYKRSSVQFVQCETTPFVLPGLVEFVVHPARNLGHFVDEFDIRLRIQMTKKLVRVVQYVEVQDFQIRLEFIECLLEGLSGANVTRTG